jgi:G6PDH family F420-dependent oxidoreductase
VVAAERGTAGDAGGGVEVIRELWAGETVEHFGRHYTVDNARLYSRPPEPPPIVVAAGGTRAAELAGRIGDGLIAVTPEVKLVESFAAAGGEGKPLYGQIEVCVAADEAEARRTARAQWATPAAIPPRRLSKLRVPADFEAVAELIGEDDVCKRVVCGADPDAHVTKVKEFAEAGFDHVHVHQVGADQEAFFRLYERELLPRCESSERGSDAEDDRARRGRTPTR